VKRRDSSHGSEREMNPVFNENRESPEPSILEARSVHGAGRMSRAVLSGRFVVGEMVPWTEI